VSYCAPLAALLDRPGLSASEVAASKATGPGGDRKTKFGGKARWHKYANMCGKGPECAAIKSLTLRHIKRRSLERESAGSEGAGDTATAKRIRVWCKTSMKSGQIAKA